MSSRRRAPLVRHGIFPATLVAALLATHALLARDSAPQAVILIWFGLMPVVALLERLMPRHPDWNRSHGDRLTDAIYLPASLVVAGGLSALWGGFHVFLAGEITRAVGAPVWPAAWPIAAQVVLACAAAELFAYWPHRWMHESPLLWRFHAIHHSARRVYWLNGLRAHPGEHLFRGFISSIPLGVAGAPPEVLAYVLVVSRVAGLFQHANIDFALGPFAWIFSIGELHRWHHSRVRGEADHNYGDTFIVWDTLFGTRYLPAGAEAPREAGFEGVETYPTSWWAQQLEPFRSAPRGGDREMMGELNEHRVSALARRPGLGPFLVLALCLAACSDAEPAPIDYSGPVAGWTHSTGNLAGQRYSPLTQIDRENVGQLEEAWRFESGDVSPTTSLQVTPILVDDALVLCTPTDQVIAIDAETGAERWRFDPAVNLEGVYNPVCRGVAHAIIEAPTAECRSRIFLGTLDARLIALDAKTGVPCAGFGTNGGISLLVGLGDVRPGEYAMTSPPMVVGDRVVTGAWVTDGQRVDSPGGVIRAFDSRTGALVWAWDPVPDDRDPVRAADIAAGGEYTRGTANAWTLLSADVEQGLVFVPTGNASPDHYGGERHGLDAFSSSVVALDAKTGARRWHFQTVHHDLWDYDVASQPVLYEQPAGAPGGEGRPALAQATKMGHIFLLDRLTGEPIFPVEERTVPKGDVVAGEYVSPTQPFPTLPAPLHPHSLPPEDVWGLTPIDRSECRRIVGALRNEGIFTPPSREGTIVFPGLGGGVNWGSVSVDPAEGTLVVNSMRNPFIVSIVPREEATSLDGTDLVGAQPQEGTPYVTIRAPLLSSWGMPCTPPPWGHLTSIDLATGKTRWQVPLGNLRELAPAFGQLFRWGTPNQGGPIQTAGGLVFIGATMDRTFRAFDAETGDVLWRALLPTSAHATPMTYRLREDGRQFVVIAAGGHFPLGSPPDDALIAYALPEPE